jgi:hypothetical protein
MALNLMEKRDDLDAQFRIPLPIATGGIGLFLAYVIPGGLTGGQGFLIGLVVGFVVLFVSAFSAKTESVVADMMRKESPHSDLIGVKEIESRLVHCPHCHTQLRVSISIASKQDKGEDTP